MENVRLTIEIPAELATAIAGFLESLKIVAVEKNNNVKNAVDDVVDVVDDVVEPPESAEEVIRFCEENDLVVNGRRFFNYYKDRKWHDTNGNQISNWKERILMWDESDRKKSPGKAPSRVMTTGKDDTSRLAKKLGVEEGE